MLYEDFCKNVKLPKMYMVKQRFERPQISDVRKEVLEKINCGKISSLIGEGDSVCITAGSRGIHSMPTVLKAVVDFCKEKKARPFLVPAMGSHGGATAEGQLAILAGYGITEESMGCPIKASMDTTPIGKTEQRGLSVYIDSFAAKADKVIVVNRIKAHTAFSGPFESGLMKMMTIGLGKQKGAETCHNIGFKYMNELVPDFGKAIIKNANIAFGVAIIENAFDEACQIEALKADEFESKEPELLIYAKSLMGRILIDETDVLIVDEIGKNISGEGADPHVTGLFPTPYVSGGIKLQRSVCLGLTEEAHGCAYGMGQFDCISEKLRARIVPESGYANAMTSKLLCQCRMPMCFSSDKLAIQAAVKSCYGIDFDNPKIVRIRNSAKLDLIQVSEGLLEEVKACPNLELISGPDDFDFDANDNLALLK